ncbi:MAG: glutamate--tRNA ligase [Alphaproteobacteria bacterium]|nr:MAG: glutamate--tRNA ligase [Alphaproteobacteria bacterium]
MSVIVRFAPSPTGRIHVGNVRTALLNYLFAKKHGGQFMLRIDDTDLERSTKEYAEGIFEDMDWLGLTHDLTANQSDRFDRYDQVVEKLKAEGLLYPCYETADELDMKRKRQRMRGQPPVYDRAALSLTDEEKAKFEAEGRKPHWRFKLSGAPAEWEDMIRGPVSIDTASVSDPVLIRGDGTYLYTLPSCVDDIDFGITHIIRGEDHVTNSGTQIEIFKAVGGKAPIFGHHPFLVGADGKGLSKRLGSLSIRQMRESGVEPMALNSYLAKIGTSDAVEPCTAMDKLVEEMDLGKISRAPARFDEAELKGLNARMLHGLTYEEVKPRLTVQGLEVSEALWAAVHENIEVLPDLKAWVNVVEGPVTPLTEDQEFASKALELLPEGEFTPETWGTWTSAVKEATGAKGKALFMPLRKALTGLDRGPSMENLLVLIGPERAKARLRGETA